MPRDDSGHPADWLRLALRDWERVGQMLSLHDAADAGFHLQQAVEKLLKAFLLSKGWKLSRVHDLPLLLTEASVHDRSLEQFRPACQRITDFYMLERYPTPMDSGLAEEDVREALSAITPMIEKPRKALSD